MAAETLIFTLEGTEYEVPAITDFDLDEWQVMWDYAGLVLDDFAPLDDDDAEAERRRRLRNPAFTKALLHIGLQRAHPDMKPRDVGVIVGKANLIRVMEAMGEAADAEEGDADPPASTSAPEPSSPPNSGGSSESGSVVSLPSSDTPADEPAPTTTGELASSSG